MIRRTRKTTKGMIAMTEQQIREKVVNVMRGWVGATMYSAKHKDIVDTYNSHKPLARSYALKMSDAYCAGTISAAWIKADVWQVAVLEVSAPKIVTLAQQKNIWKENDAYIPKPGDAVAYDWDDGANYASTDNKGSPDHVGIVESVNGNTITVIEGNMGSGHVVGRRSLAVNGRYIRGFITPNYASLATPSKTVDELAREVLDGKWGNGSERRTRLTAAGYDYEAVQRRVNELVTEQQQTPKVLYAEKYDKKIAGVYTVKSADGLNLRYGPGTGYGVIKTLANGTTVRNYGYYTARNGVKWYYVRVNNSTVVGFVSSQYLVKK